MRPVLKTNIDEPSSFTQPINPLPLCSIVVTIAEGVHGALVNLPQNRDWSLRDVFPILSACDRLFDASLAAICRAEGSKGRMKAYLDAVCPDAHWEFLCPIFISQPVAEGKGGSLPSATRKAVRALLIRDNVDQSRDPEGRCPFEIKTAQRLCRELPEFFQAAADVVSNTDLRAAFRTISETLARR